MRAVQILTDKNHYHTKLEVFPSLKVNAAKDLCISKDYKDDFYGFGVAITGSSCYNLSLMQKDERKQFLESIYSKDGLNLSVARLSIGSSDYSAEVYSYNDCADDFEMKNFSIKHDEKYIIPIIKEILEIKPDLYIFASPWSPPGWMKTGGSMCGGYMREKYLECYADYIVKYISEYNKHGINISAITPQNESNTQQGGRMPACIWHPELEAKFTNILKNKFISNSLNVKIWINDHNFSDTDRVMWMLGNCDNLTECCDGVAFHYYSGTIEETLKINRKYPDLKLHFSEGGPRLFDNYATDWCKWGIMISKAIKYGYASFTGWNLMLNEMGGPNVGPFLCGGLVTRNVDNGELDYSGQYKAFSHIAPYINQNSKLYPVSVTEEYDINMSDYPKTPGKIEGFLIDNGGAERIVVLINPNEQKSQVQFEVLGVNLYAELTPDSISTFIIK